MIHAAKIAAMLTLAIGAPALDAEAVETTADRFVTRDTASMKARRWRCGLRLPSRTTGGILRIAGRAMPRI